MLLDVNDNAGNSGVTSGIFTLSDTLNSEVHDGMALPSLGSDSDTPGGKVKKRKAADDDVHMPKKDKHEEDILLQDNNAATVGEDVMIQVKIDQQEKEHFLGNDGNQVQQIYVASAQNAQPVGLPMIAQSGRCDRRATGPAPKDGRDPTRSYCDKCPKNYKKPKHLKEHQMKRCGQVEKQFKCETCEKKFHYQESLQDHLGKKHAKIKRHICIQCTEAFYYRKDLKEHQVECHSTNQQ